MKNSRVSESGEPRVVRSVSLDRQSHSRVYVEEGCERTQRQHIHRPCTSHHNTPTSTARAWRSDVPPLCLGGASHGWVPVNTHGILVLTSVRRLWVAQPRPRAHASDTRREIRSSSSKDAVHPNMIVEQGW